jgi:hypothetical protein
LRILLIILGCTGLGWGLLSFPIFWQEMSIERVARQIVRGEPYKVESLIALTPTLQTLEKSHVCYAPALWSAAVIRLRILEQVGADRFGSTVLESPQTVIRRSLACSPAEPFLWLALYWTDVTQYGFETSSQNYLRLSYQLGPNEGWIALKRNPFVFLNFQRLASDIGNEGIEEFIRLLKSQQFFVEAANILVGPAWAARDKLLPRLQDLTERDRKTFAQVLESKGYNVSIPGIGKENRRAVE